MNAVEKTTHSQLRDQVQHIVNTIENGCRFEEGDYYDYEYEIGDTISAFDYLADSYDIEYYVQSDRKTVNGARFCVAFGGPNVYIDTRFQTVEGYWWGEKVIMRYYDDPMGLNEVAEELWGC